MEKQKICDSLGLMPQEETLEIKPNFKKLQIGIPKESSLQENRVSLTPDAIGLLVKNGHSVLIESGAGNAANFTDEMYSQKGAEISN